MPWRQCPRCVLQLSDYVGGSHSTPYVNAMNFLSINENVADTNDKFARVIRGIYSKHRNVFEVLPEAIKLLPDPSSRSQMSKRVWEKTLCRARRLLCFLDDSIPANDILFFRYLHAETEGLSTVGVHSLRELPRPAYFSEAKEWRNIAFLYALELHLALTVEHQQRSHATGISRRNDLWEDELGGAACPTTTPSLTRDLSHAQWLRLSAHRAQAFAKRQERRRKESGIACDEGFDLVWQKSFSPFCCPTYGSGTSLIRLPVLLPGQCALPMLLHVPSNFLDFRCPDVTCEVLARLHEHDRDKCIAFVSSSHTYYVAGNKIPVSVTGLVHLFVKSFDPDQAIENMKRSRLWPRQEYSNVVNGELVEMSSEEIKQLWRKNAAEASLRGTFMHLQIEVLLNGGYVAGSWVELELFAQMLREFPERLMAFRTEWSIFAEQEHLAGWIDFVAKTVSGEVILFDWKRTKNLQDKYTNPWSNMSAPLSHPPDCVGLHYRLQLNVYKYILQKYYNVSVGGMYVVCLHPDLENVGPFLDQVPDMSADVKLMLDGYLSRSSRQQSSTAEESWQGTYGGSVAASQDSFVDRVEAELEDHLNRPDVVASDTAVQNQFVEESEELIAADDPFQEAKKRRLMPGADQTRQNFDGLFAATAASSEACLAGLPRPADRNTDRTIVFQTSRYLEQVRQRQPAWSDHMRHLAAAALGVYRTRISDLFVRDYVALLWVIEGDRFLRAHGGVCYLYHEHGAFQAFVGVPPESTFARLKPFLLQLEGIFRLMRPGVERNDAALLGEIERLFQEHNHETEFLNHCLDEAIMSGGKKTERRSFGRHEQEQAPVAEEGRAEANKSCSWPSLTADMISRVAVPLQKDLLEERKLLQYVAHWCSTISPRCPGVAYADCCVLYDSTEAHITRLVAPSPDLNLYVRIAHPLQAYTLDDPEFKGARVRLEKFFRQTFWCNENFLQASMAALALAERGENIDRCFIGESPGGTGQSMYSSHLAAVYGRNHAFIDSNLFHNEDEMRKQLESFARCFILTAQETPETNRAFQQDLFKKLVSADDLAARRPYGFVTRMLRCFGWKRYESNQIMQFKNVKERNFLSIYRRCAVWEPKPLFWDDKVLQAEYPDSYLDGIFAKDTTLRAFLESGPAIAASLFLQHGFESHHSRERCRDLIEKMAVEGVAEKKIREACGLEHAEENATPNSAQALANMVRSASTLDADKNKEAQKPEHERVGDAMITYGLNTKATPPTKLRFNKLWWNRFAASKLCCKTETLETLLRKQVVAFAGGHGDAKMSSESYVPIVPFNKQLTDVCDAQPAATVLELAESYDTRMLWQVLQRIQ